MGAEKNSRRTCASSGSFPIGPLGGLCFAGPIELVEAAIVKLMHHSDPTTRRTPQQRPAGISLVSWPRHGGFCNY